MYLKEGGSDYATVNPQNLKPIFSQEQLATSLHTTKLYSTAVSGAYIIDINQLTEDIQSAYLHDSSLLHSYPDLPCLSDHYIWMVYYSSTTGSMSQTTMTYDFKSYSSSMITCSQVI